MNVWAFIISIISLLLGCLAYWRAGGKEEVLRVRLELDREIETLRLKQRELVESISQTVAIAYERNRQRLTAVREQVRLLRDEAAVGLDKQVKRAQEQLDTLGQRLEEGAKSARDVTVTAAQKTEEAITLRVHRLEARMDLLLAKCKANRAIVAAEKTDFDSAEQYLDEAADLLQRERQKLGDDHAYDKSFDTVKAAMGATIAAVRTHAVDARQKVDRLMSETDQFVRVLESDEEKAAMTPA